MTDHRKPLTPEESWVILQKGTERPFTGNTTTTLMLAFTFVASVISRCIALKTSFRPTAAGLPSTMKYQARFAGKSMLMATGSKSSVVSAMVTWGMFLKGSGSPKKTPGTALIRSQCGFKPFNLL